MGNPVRRQIWCLWEPAGTLPPYLRLCFRTIERNAGVPVELLSASDVQRLSPELDPSLAARIPRLAMRADYYRSHLLSSQGGLWLDVDSVVLRDLTWLFELADVSGIALRKNEIGVGVALIAATAASPHIHRWIELQEDLLRRTEPGDDLHWSSLGAVALTEALGGAPYGELPRAAVAPLTWRQADLFVSRYARPDALLSPEVSIVNLYNERFPQSLRLASESEILSSPIMLARLLRIALGESDLVEEHRWNDPLGRLVESVSQTLLRAGRWGRRRVTARLGPH